MPRGATAPLIDMLRGFKRQALHAAALSFDHPRTGKRLSLASPVPADLAALLAVLRTDAGDAAGATANPR